MNKAISLFLTLILVLGVLTAIPFSVGAEATTGVPAGSGTEEDPYIIMTPVEYQWIIDNAKDTAGTPSTTADSEKGRTIYMELGADIDLNSESGGTIGSIVPDLGWGNHAPNCGWQNEWHFNGNGHVIRNMSSMLFCSIKPNSVIENIRFEAAEVSTSTSNAGLLVGYAPGGVTIKNVFIDENSSFSGNSNHAGGFVGAIGSEGPTLIENCINAADVTNIRDGEEDKNAGAFIAKNDRAATLINCVNFGDIKGTVNAGGLIGNASGQATITNCVNLGSVTASSSQAIASKTGDIYGNKNNTPVLTNCYVAADWETKEAEIRLILAEIHDCDYPDGDCQAICEICGLVRPGNLEHVYDNACDATCNVCQGERVTDPHLYDNACDTTCNICAAERTVGEHIYDHAKDTTCNVCSATRTLETKAPVADTTAPTTNDTTATEEQGGCGASVNSTYAIIALGAIFGFAFVAKKREEN